MLGAARSIAPLCLLLLQAAATAHDVAPVLTRDVDKRPLPRVLPSSLKPEMRKALQELFSQEGEPESYVVHRIPVAPRGHELYFVEESGKKVCAENTPNCSEVVFDETPKGVTTVADWSGTGVLVVRRQNLQMPDIATIEQLGHASAYTTVFRFTQQAGWKPYLCNEVPIGEDAVNPHPDWVAYKRCSAGS